MVLFHKISHLKIKHKDLQINPNRFCHLSQRTLNLDDIASHYVDIKYGT